MVLDHSFHITQVSRKFHAYQLISCSHIHITIIHNHSYIHTHIYVRKILTLTKPGEPNLALALGLGFLLPLLDYILHNQPSRLYNKLFLNASAMHVIQCMIYAINALKSVSEIPGQSVVS